MFHPKKRARDESADSEQEENTGAEQNCPEEGDEDMEGKFSFKTLLKSANIFHVCFMCPFLHTQ